MSSKRFRTGGFTIIELLVVIAVIAILTAIVYVSYSGAQNRARIARMTSEAYTLKEAIETGRIKTQKTLQQITGTYWTGQYCLYQPAGAPSPGASIPPGTDLSVQTPTTQRCWTDYQAALQKITDASGVDVTSFKDPWGRPYYIDENEQDSGTYECSSDVIAWLAYPFAGATGQDWSLQIFVPPYKSKC